MNLDLDGKVALICGASRGIGAAAAKALAEDGAHLMLAARTAPPTDELKEAFADIEIGSIAVDFMKERSGEEAVQATVNRFGRIDILVVSIGAAQGGLFWTLEDKVWEDAFALKFMGMIRLMRAAGPVMAEQGAGSIVVVVGNNGRQPSARMAPGSAANAACLAAVRCLAEELAPKGVRVNAVNPGPTRTGRWDVLMDRLSKQSGRAVEEEEAAFRAMIPAGRINTPEEVASVIAFCASDKAPCLTSAGITVDGGATKGSP